MNRKDISQGMILYQINPYEVPDAIRVVRWQVRYVRRNSKGEDYARLDRVDDPRGPASTTVRLWTMDAHGIHLTQVEAEEAAKESIRLALNQLGERLDEKMAALHAVWGITRARLDSEDMAAQAVAK